MLWTRLWIDSSVFHDLGLSPHVGTKSRISQWKYLLFEIPFNPFGITFNWSLLRITALFKLFNNHHAFNCGCSVNQIWLALPFDVLDSMNQQKFSSTWIIWRLAFSASNYLTPTSHDGLIKAHQILLNYTTGTSPQ